MLNADELFAVRNLTNRINSWCMPVHHTAQAPQDFLDGGASVRRESLRSLSEVRRCLDELERLLRKESA